MHFETFSQKTDDQMSREDSVVEFPDVEPSYPGGELELQKFIAKNLNFPVDCLTAIFMGELK
jgi:hypothetical protein